MARLLGRAENRQASGIRRTGKPGAQESRDRQVCQPSPYLFGDVTILVNVIEIEGPLELLVDRPSEQDGEPNHEVL